MKRKHSEEKNENATKKGHLRENIEAILVAVLIALFIRTFVVQAFKIPSGSMKQTLQIGDHILVNKFLYGVKIPYWNKTIIPFKEPRRADIIVFKFPQDPSKDFIKRVIGVGGDVVESRDKQLYVNHKRVNHDFGVHTDPHIISSQLRPRDNFGPITVPENSLFVMGDNRVRSRDSRDIGSIHVGDVIGYVDYIYFPSETWSRFGVYRD